MSNNGQASATYVVVAQMRKPIMVTRICTGSDGQSHADGIEMKMTGITSETVKAAGVQFGRRPSRTAAGSVTPDPRFAPLLQQIPPIQ